MALAGLSVCGVAFAEVVWWRALLVMTAWGVAADIWPAGPEGSIKKGALRSGLFLAPLGVALIAAGWDFAAAVRPQPEQPAAGGDPYWGK